MHPPPPPQCSRLPVTSSLFSNQPAAGQVEPDPSSLLYGPALLTEYDRANQEKSELLTRMIRSMRDRAAPHIDNDGRPSHPKYSLLKLDPPPTEQTKTRSRSVRKADRPADSGGVRESNEPKAVRKQEKRFVSSSFLIKIASVY